MRAQDATAALMRTRDSRVPGAGLEPARLAAADFKSATATNFVTRACGAFYATPVARLDRRRRRVVKSSEEPPTLALCVAHAEERICIHALVVEAEATLARARRETR